jgi:hypothetical protein
VGWRCAWSRMGFVSRVFVRDGFFLCLNDNGRPEARSWGRGKGAIEQWSASVAWRRAWSRMGFVSRVFVRDGFFLCLNDNGRPEARSWARSKGAIEQWSASVAWRCAWSRMGFVSRVFVRDGFFLCLNDNRVVIQRHEVGRGAKEQKSNGALRWGGMVRGSRTRFVCETSCWDGFFLCLNDNRVVIQRHEGPVAEDDSRTDAARDSGRRRRGATGAAGWRTRRR